MLAIYFASPIASACFGRDNCTDVVISNRTLSWNVVLLVLHDAVGASCTILSRDAKSRLLTTFRNKTDIVSLLEEEKSAKAGSSCLFFPLGHDSPNLHKPIRTLTVDTLELSIKDHSQTLNNVEAIDLLQVFVEFEVYRDTIVVKKVSNASSQNS